MNFQVTVLKVLVSYPGGFAVMDDIKRDMALLATSGRDWADRTKRLAARVPEPRHIFAGSGRSRKRRVEDHRQRSDRARVHGGAHRLRPADRGGSARDSRCTRTTAAAARGAGEAKAGTARASPRRTRASSSDRVLKAQARQKAVSGMI